MDGHIIDDTGGPNKWQPYMHSALATDYLKVYMRYIWYYISI